MAVRRIAALFALATLACAAAAAGCKSSSGGVDPFATADEAAAEPDPFAEDGEPRRVRTTASTGGDDAVLVLPEPPEATRYTIDGEVGDWSGVKSRTFDSARAVQSGEQFWDSASDASFTVAVDADAGHLYLRVEVRDDRVIDAESADIMADGIVVWLRDPRLDEVLEALPPSVAGAVEPAPELGILFTPDGQFWRRDGSGRPLYRAGIDAQTTRRDAGYRLEAAIALGALEQVARWPVEDLAFRVELMDGDEAARRGEQTRMSMLPATEADAPRFALYNVGAMVPYEPVHGQPPRTGALGRWMLGEEGHWRFQSFEAQPAHWRVLEDVGEFEAALSGSEVFSEICKVATDERRLIEAYQSRSGRHRAGLVLCGPRAPKGRCPDDAQTHLFWAHLEPDQASGGWHLAHLVEATDAPLAQCATAPSGDRPYFTEFSLAPLEMMGSSIWGVGWRRQGRTSAERIDERGVWFVDASAPKGYAGKILTSRVEATPSQRILSDSKVYLTPLDDTAGLDVCAVERWEEQDCRGMDRGCVAGERDRRKRVHVRLWNPRKRAMDLYFQTKHPTCTVDFDFPSHKAYLLLQTEHRLGALASPALRE